jgi:hypothetical protein
MRTEPAPGVGIARSTISNEPFGRETWTARIFIVPPIRAGDESRVANFHQELTGHAPAKGRSDREQRCAVGEDQGQAQLPASALAQLFDFVLVRLRQEPVLPALPKVVFLTAGKVHSSLWLSRWEPSALAQSLHYLVQWRHGHNVR